MAANPWLRNGSLPIRTASASSNTTSSTAQQSAPAAGRPSNRYSETADGRICIVLPRQLYIPEAILEKFVNDDPMFGTLGAAIILGVSADLLRKWRQRGKGPQYYKFGEHGPIVYSLKSLNAFKAAHLVTPSKKGGKQ
jgi:hypothetical protein